MASAQDLKLKWAALLLVENSTVMVAEPRPNARGVTTNVTAILELKPQWGVQHAPASVERKDGPVRQTLVPAHKKSQSEQWVKKKFWNVTIMAGIGSGT